EALDRQFNVALAVPDVAAVAVEYARLSRQAQARVAGEIGVSYGPSEAERVDIYPATGGGPAPVLLFYHGGYWRGLSSAEAAFMAHTFTAAGCCVVAVNF